MNALTLKNVTKIYPRFKLDGVSFSVKEGHVVGLVGRNGAGKTTTLKAVFNLITFEGEVDMFELNVREHEQMCKQITGYVGGGFRFYPQKTLNKIALAVSAFYSAWSWETYRNYLAQFGLDEQKKICELSEGMKVKFALTLALSHGAKLLILDEPTSGLDPLSREEFCDIMLDLVKNAGVSVLFSTHITSDLERIADDVVYLFEGKVLFDTATDELLSRYFLATFASESDAVAAKALGVKQAKHGFEGLVPQGALPENCAVKDATIDDILIHLETEAKL